MPAAELTTNLTVIPVAWRRSSTTIVLSGSAAATVSTPPSTVIGQTRYWRRYLAETFFSTGTVDGSSSRQTYGRFCCTASARATSSSLTAPRATRASPINSAVVRCRATARSTASAGVNPPVPRISPRRPGAAPPGRRLARRPRARRAHGVRRGGHRRRLHGEPLARRHPVHRGDAAQAARGLHDRVDHAGGRPLARGGPGGRDGAGRAHAGG